MSTDSHEETNSSNDDEHAFVASLATQRGTTGLSEVFLSLFALIGLAGSAIRYTIASDAGFGVIASAVAGVAGFAGAIGGAVLSILTVVFLIEYVGVAIGDATVRVSQQLFSHSVGNCPVTASVAFSAKPVWVSSSSLRFR